MQHPEFGATSGTSFGVLILVLLLLGLAGCGNSDGDGNDNPVLSLPDIMVDTQARLVSTSGAYTAGNEPQQSGSLSGISYTMTLPGFALCLPTDLYAPPVPGVASNNNIANLAITLGQFAGMSGIIVDVLEDALAEYIQFLLPTSSRFTF